MISMGLKCQIRYAILEPKLVFNYIGPSVGYHRNPDRKQLEEARINERNSRDSFFSNLEQSILHEGIRNPIVVNGGWISGGVFKELPDEVQKQGLERLIICFQIGGSRLWVAQKHNIMIPCIIRDFVGRFTQNPLLDTEEKVRELYKDQPVSVRCDGTQVNIAWSGVKV